MTPESITAGLSRFATGVTIVSVRDDSEWGDSDDIATTVSAFMPVSLQPPLVAMAVNAASYAAEVLGRVDGWGLSVLAAGQTQLAGRFSAAGRPSPRLLLADTPHHRGEQTGALLLDEGCATMECRTTERIRAGDHLLVLAEVLAVTAIDREPLVRFGRAYRGLAPR
ncbi:MAG TPA: flavin reductase family protein [Cryptosporangiaceae bacterium]|nr:flavin reductase family protein [Cryptosporangiaceae bacterium]